LAPTSFDAKKSKNGVFNQQDGGSGTGKYKQYQEYLSQAFQVPF
jgi:hypothetical protein